MAKTQSVWGIDVGRCALTAIKLRLGTEGVVELVAHEYIEHEKILSQPDADRSALIAAALEKFLAHNDISKDTVVVSAPGQHTLARFTKLPPCPTKRIPDIVRYEADQQIPFDMDEVIWDYQIFQQEDSPDIEVGIFAMKRELLREHLLYFEQAAIEPVVVQPTPLAVYNAMRADGRLEDDTTVLLDIGADNADLVIATKHGLWTRTIPIGGNNCTEALVKSFKLSFAKAENLKRTAETSKYRRQIFQAMRPIFADIVQELQRSIGFYSSTHRDAKIGKVIAVGNAFKLPGLQKYLQQNLGLDVECPDKFAKVSPSSPGLGGALEEQFLSFWAAYGLALQGLDRVHVTSNLLPKEIAKQLVWRKKRPAFAAIAACLVLTGGAVWFRQTADMSALAAHAGNWDTVRVSDDRAWATMENGPSSAKPARERAAIIKAAGQSLKKQLSALSGKGENERSNAEELVRIQRSKALVPAILQAIHDALPAGDDALLGASTPADAARIVVEGLGPRDERRQVVIRSINMQYETQVKFQGDRTWPDALIASRDPVNEVDAEIPGIMIMIECATSNKRGRNFLKSAFLDPLFKNGRRPGQGFYFDRVNLVFGMKIQPLDDPFGAGNRPHGSGGRGRSGALAGSLKGASRYDPLTNELIENDLQFEIWIDAILEDLPESAMEEETGGDGE